MGSPKKPVAASSGLFDDSKTLEMAENMQLRNQASKSNVVKQAIFPVSLAGFSYENLLVCLQDDGKLCFFKCHEQN